MRTTIDIPDDLGRQIKVRAAQLGRPLKWVMMRALEREIKDVGITETARRKRVLPVIRSHAPGSLTLSPEEISALLVREESAAYGSDVRR